MIYLIKGFLANLHKWKSGLGLPPISTPQFDRIFSIKAMKRLNTRCNQLSPLCNYLHRPFCPFSWQQIELLEFGEFVQFGTNFISTREVGRDYNNLLHNYVDLICLRGFICYDWYGMIIEIFSGGS